MLNLTKRLRTIAASAVLTIGAVAGSNAYAGAVFQVNPNSNGLSSSGAIFSADAMSGSSSARITNTGGTTYSGVGYIIFDAFSLAGSSVPVPFSRVGFDYRLYAKFTQTFTCSGLLTSTGTNCLINTIDLTLFAEQGFDTIFNQATLGSDPSVIDGNNPIELATVTVVNSGTAGINGLGGAFQNVNTNFALTTPAGTAFFMSPSPFYSFAFSAFNNTSLGLKCNTAGCINATTVAINSEAGITDFIGVPEPAPLALIGLGLFGLVAYRRKGRA